MAGFHRSVVIRRDFGNARMRLDGGAARDAHARKRGAECEPVCGGFRPRGDRTRVGKLTLLGWQPQ